jgi:hypothetical protein
MSNGTSRGNPNHPMNNGNPLAGNVRGGPVHQIVIDIMADGMANARCSSSLTPLCAARALCAVAASLIQTEEQRQEANKISVPDSATQSALLGHN